MALLWERLCWPALDGLRRKCSDEIFRLPCNPPKHNKYKLKHTNNIKLTDAQTSRLRQSSSLYPEPPCLVLCSIRLGAKERAEIETACNCAHVSEILIDP